MINLTEGPFVDTHVHFVLMYKCNVRYIVKGMIKLSKTYSAKSDVFDENNELNFIPISVG